jgi:GPH family glycoside/pentoside/hexuronide:cation symporter
MDTAGKLSASYVVIGVKEKIGYGFGDFASIYLSVFLCSYCFFIPIFTASVRCRPV